MSRQSEVLFSPFLNYFCAKGFQTSVPNLGIHSKSLGLLQNPGFSTALRIPTVHNFVSLAHTHEDVRIQIVRDFPQTKLESEINAPFLLNAYTCVSHFLFHDFNKNNILNN